MKRIKNIQMQSLITELKRTAAKNDAAIWKRIAVELEKPTRNKRVVNVFKIDKNSNENDTVIVPGKVLGMGNLSKKLTVVAYNFSDDARKKISEKGKCMSIQEFVTKNPKCKDARIIG